MTINKIIFQIKKTIFRFIGDIKWAGVLHPFWFVINATTFKLKGKHYRTVEEIIQPGDIIIRRFEGYVDKWLIPGFWNHAGIYIVDIKGRPHKVIHSISDGVIVEDLIDFMRTDHMIILRAKNGGQQEAILRAKRAVGSEYDFEFDFEDTLRFSCTELIKYCYPETVSCRKILGKIVVVADDIINSKSLKVIWDSRQ